MLCSLVVRSIPPNARRLRVDLVECVGETSVSEDRLEKSLKDDVDKPPVESLVLEHVEHEHDTLASRLRPNQMLQLLC